MNDQKQSDIEERRNEANIPEILREKERQEILKGTDKAGAEISTDIFAYGSEKEIAKKEIEKVGEHISNEVDQIESIDITKSPEEQSKNIELLEAVSNRLIGKLESKNIDTSDIRLLNEPTSKQILECGLTAIDIKTIEKLKEIGENPDAPLSKAWIQEWGKIRKVALEDLAVAQKIKKGTQDSTTKKIWDYMKNEPLKSAAIITAGAVGAWMVWKLFKKISSNDPNVEKSKGKEAAEIIGTGAIAAGIGTSLFMLGGILDVGGWRQWIREKMNINLTPRNVWRYIIHGFKLSELKDGMIEIDDFSKKVAKHIKGSAEEVAMLSKINYKEFMSGKSEIKDIIHGNLPRIARELGVPEFALTGIEDEEKAMDTAQKLRAFLKSKEAQIILKDKNPNTIKEALKMLEESGLFDHGEKPSTPKQKEKDEDDKDENDDFEGRYAWSGESARRLIGILGEHSATSEVLNDPEASILHPWKFVTDLNEAVNKDGHALVSANGILGIVIEGYGWFTISSLGIINNTFEKIWAGESKGDVATGYMHDSLGFIMVMAGARVTLEVVKRFIGQSSNQSLISEAAKGIGEGLLMPATAVKYHRFAGEWMTRVGKETIFSMKAWMSDQNSEVFKEARLQQLNHYIELFEYYDTEYDKVQEGSIKRVEAHTRTWRNKESLKRMRDKYAGKVERYQKKAFHEGVLPPEMGETSGGPEDGVQALKDTIRDIKTYLEETKAAKVIEYSRTIDDIRTRSAWDEFKNKTFEKFLRKNGIKPGTSNANSFMENQIERLLIERGIEKNSPEGRAFLDAWGKTMGEQLAQGENIDINGQIKEEWYKSALSREGVSGASIRPPLELITSKCTLSNKVYRYMGSEFKIPKTIFETFPDISIDPKGHMEAAREFCSKKWRIPAGENLKIEVVKNATSSSPPTYRINGEIIEGTSDIESARLRYLDVLEKEGKPAPPEFLEMLQKINHPAWKWVGPIEKVLGTIGTVALLLILFGEKDKHKAVVEVSSILATGLGGAKLFESTLGKLSKNPAYQLIGNFTFGLLAYYNLDDEAQIIFSEVLERLHLDSKKATETISEIMSLQIGVKMALPITMQGIEKIATKESTGALGKFLTKKIGRTAWIEGVGKIAGQKIVKKILIKLGWRGAVAGVLFADDATLIGILDDAIAIGLVGWTAVDIIQLTTIVANAIEFEKEMERRKTKKITGIKLQPEHEKRVIQTMESAGYKKSEIFKDGHIDGEVFNNFTESQLIETIGDGVIEIIRENEPGKEIWKIEQGEVSAITYLDKSGNMIAQMEEKVVTKTQEAIAELEESESSTKPNQQ